jgi:hypothetical protein
MQHETELFDAAFLLAKEAVTTMRRPFPGFSEATSRAAQAHGYFVSR